jgi:hypothetical protein
VVQLLALLQVPRFSLVVNFAFTPGCDWAFSLDFRISEYGQSRLNAGQRFQVIPDSSAVPPLYRQTPLAFVRGDFLFLDASSRTIDHISLAHRHALNEVQTLEITWRYDKSAHNFTKRGFLLTGHPIFDPVDAGVSIIHRANLMGVPFDEPIGVWRPTVTSPFPYQFVKDSDVSRVMRDACMHAYPDLAHYMRQHIQQLVPHSNGVTAAVYLSNGWLVGPIMMRSRLNYVGIPHRSPPICEIVLQQLALQ